MHRGGGAYTRDATFSFAITSSHTFAINREMFSGCVDSGFVLALPFHHGDLEPDCVGVSTRSRHLSLYFSHFGGEGGEGCGEYEAQGGEMLLTLAVGWRASALRGEEVGRFCEVAGVSIVAAGGPRSR